MSRKKCRRCACWMECVKEKTLVAAELVEGAGQEAGRGLSAGRVRRQAKKWKCAGAGVW